MAVDIAIDPSTGDLVSTVGNDLLVRTGEDVVAQRIRVRLMIHQGTWTLDPTGGTLGSNILELTRLPIDQALAQLPNVVKQALQPMDDITVNDVTCSVDPNHSNTINFTIVYTVTGDGEADAQTFTDTLTLDGGNQ